MFELNSNLLNDKEKQILDFSLAEDSIKNFDSLIQSVFKILSMQLGFKHPFLFMYREEYDDLFLVKSELSAEQIDLLKQRYGIDPHVYQVSVKDSHNPIAYSFRSQKIVQALNLGQVFNIIHPDHNSALFDSNIIVLPIVLQKPIAVLVFQSENKKTLSSLERAYLKSFALHISTFLYTAWIINKSSVAIKQLSYANSDFADLIQVKKAFLEDIQKLLISISSQNLIADAQHQEILETLLYLNSILLLSNNTVAKHQDILISSIDVIE